MPTDIFVSRASAACKQICLANHSGNFAPIAQRDMRAPAGDRDDIQMTFDHTAGTHFQSAGFDLGAAFAPQYAVRVYVVTAGVSSSHYSLYYSGSVSQGANPLGDGDATKAAGGYTANGWTELQFVGQFVGDKSSYAGFFTPSQRYGSIVVQNDWVTNQTGDVSSAIYLDPVFPQSQ